MTGVSQWAGMVAEHGLGPPETSPPTLRSATPPLARPERRRLSKEDLAVDPSDFQVVQPPTGRDRSRERRGAEPASWGGVAALVLDDHGHSYDHKTSPPAQRLEAAQTAETGEAAQSGAVGTELLWHAAEVLEAAQGRSARKPSSRSASLDRRAGSHSASIDTTVVPLDIAALPEPPTWSGVSAIAEAEFQRSPSSFAADLTTHFPAPVAPAAAADPRANADQPISAQAERALDAAALGKRPPVAAATGRNSPFGSWTGISNSMLETDYNARPSPPRERPSRAASGRAATPEPTAENVTSNVPRTRVHVPCSSAEYVEMHAHAKPEVGGGGSFGVSNAYSDFSPLSTGSWRDDGHA